MPAETVNQTVLPAEYAVPIASFALDLRTGDEGGHGVDDDAASRGKAFYEFDVPSTPMRFIVLDTCAETGGSGGIGAPPAAG